MNCIIFEDKNASYCYSICQMAVDVLIGLRSKIFDSYNEQQKNTNFDG